MAEMIFWWFFIAACVFGFIFAFGMLEDLIRQWRRDRSKGEGFSPAVSHGSPDPRGNGHLHSHLH